MSERPGLKAIESFFGMSFKDVIRKLHWQQERTILELSADCGISRDTFQRNAKRLGLSLRSSKETAYLKNPRGEKHWAYGRRKENDAWAKMHSDRMKEKNPVRKRGVRERMSATLADTFRAKLLPQEVAFKALLNELKIDHEAQVAIGSYIIDFVVPDKKLCIEIDSTYKFGSLRKDHADKKDRYLKRRGWKVMRINKVHVVKKREDVIERLRAFGLIR